MLGCTARAILGTQQRNLSRRLQPAGGGTQRRQIYDIGQAADGMKAAVLSTEYDVFQCDEFTEEKGKWLALMPDADFIPT